MAISDETRAQRAKLKGKGAKAHLKYFWDYYRIPTFVIIIAVVLGIYIIYSVATNKPDVFGLMVLNGQSSASDQYQELYDETVAALGVDTQKNDVTLDLSQRLTPGTSYSTYDMGTNEKITAEVAAHLLDVMIADQYNFDSLAYNGMFGDLRDYLTQDQLDALQGSLYYMDLDKIEAWQQASESSTYEASIPDTETAVAGEAYDSFVLPDPSTMSNPVPVGIVVNELPMNEKYGFFDTTTGIMGIISNTEQKENSISFVELMTKPQ